MRGIENPVFDETWLFDVEKPAWTLDFALAEPKLVFLEAGTSRADLPKTNTSRQAQFGESARPAPKTAAVLRQPSATQTLNQKG